MAGVVRRSKKLVSDPTAAKNMNISCLGRFFASSSRSTIEAASISRNMLLYCREIMIIGGLTRASAMPNITATTRLIYLAMRWARTTSVTIKQMTRS
jgi:hypothetical protein